ncbi:MAG: cell division protein FtsA [Rubrobacter sp.]|nr:cell division protein FtsA [Rubrobacter sp.]
MAQSFVYGIDVGTTKIVAVAGRVDPRRGRVEVLSVGEARSRGLKRGVVVDRGLAADAISEAIEACEFKSARAVVGIAGGHISSANTEVALLNRGRNLQISERFLRKLEAEARQVSLGGDERVIHVVPRGYVLDGTEGVKNPVGLEARKVKMRAHVVSGAVSSIQNLLHAVEDCGMKVSDVVLEPLASAEACLTEQAREDGVALIDIGGGTTDIAVFVRGALTHTAVVPLGGESFTSDVAYGLKIPFADAEKLKVRYGTVLSRIVDSVAPVRLGDRHYNASFLSQILEYRAREVLEYARDSISEARLLDSIPHGVVLTGGGSLLDGMPELSEEILGVRAATATLRLIKDDSKPLRKPQYSTAIGLIYFSSKNNNLRGKSKGASEINFGSIVEAVKSWFRGR